MQGGDDGDGMLALLGTCEGERRLRELELDAVCRIFPDERAHLAQVSLLLHVDAALVDGDRHDGQSFRAAVALELHDVLEVIEIEV